MKKISSLLVLTMLLLTFVQPMTFVSAETNTDILTVSDGTRIEFENFASSDSPEVGSTRIKLGSGNYAFYNVDIEQAGEYKLVSAIVFPGDLSAKPINFYSGGELLTISGIPHSKDWSTSAEREAESTFYLGEGVQTIKYENTGAAAYFDYFILERVGDVPESFTTKYELGFHAGVYDSSAGTTSAAGIKAGSFLLDKDDYALYNINVKSAGTYALKIWAGNNASTAAGLTVYQGTTLLATGEAKSTVDDKAGHDWFNWMENDFGTVVFLEEGKTTLKFLSSQSAYYTYFTLERVGDIPTTFQMRYEFEEFATTDSNTTSSSDIMLGTGKGSYATYNVNVPVAGEYKLITATIYPAAVSGTPLNVYANGEIATMSKIAQSADWWSIAEQEAENTINLGKGEQVLRFEYASSGIYFDYFILERVGDISENFTSIYQFGMHAGIYDASEETLGAAGTTTGSISLDKDDYALYNINVKSAGTYALKVWAGNNESTISAGLKVYQNSALLTAGAAKPSGGWLTWAENDFGTIVLGEGNTTFKFFAEKIAYYSQFSLTRVGDIPADKTISLKTEARESSIDTSAGTAHTTKTYLSFGKNDTVTYKANIPESGDYSFIIKAGVKTSGYSAVRMSIDGETAIASANLINNGDWSTAENTNIGSVYLEAGVSEIVLTGLADEFWLFGADITTVGEGGANTTLADYIVQAENFKNANDNTEGLDDTAENLIEYSPVEVIEENGGKVVCFAAGETLEYGLTGIREKGYYNVKFCMAGANEEYTVKVGKKGSALTEAKITPAVDGSYSVVTVEDVRLEKGNNDFVIEFAGSEGQIFKLDNITLYKETVKTTCDKAAGNATANISFEGLFSGKKAMGVLAVYKEIDGLKQLVYVDYNEAATANDSTVLGLALQNMSFEEGTTYSAKVFIWNGSLYGNCVDFAIE